MSAVQKTDKELLELAARAAGIGIIRCRLNDPLQRDMLIEKSARNAFHDNGPWNPLTDDGDALRLAVDLNILHGTSLNTQWAETNQSDDGIVVVERIEEYRNKYAATRRAIVRAAAEIGKQS